MIDEKSRLVGILALQGSFEEFAKAEFLWTPAF